MKRLTITVPDDLEAAVTEFQQEQTVSLTMGAITLVALREYLTRHGTLAPRGPLRITPVDAETAGPTDSQDHDRLFADAVARD